MNAAPVCSCTRPACRDRGREGTSGVARASSWTFSPLPAEVIAALRVHRARQVDTSGLPLPTAYVFTSINGGAIDPATLDYHFQRLLAKAGLPHFRLHDLRHSYASAALRAGVPAKVVSERLGHANISITLDTYTHVLPEQDAQAAVSVARLILGDGDSDYRHGGKTR